MKFFSPEDFAEGLDYSSAIYAAEKANNKFAFEAQKVTGNVYTYGTNNPDKWHNANFSTERLEGDTHVAYLVSPKEIGSFALPKEGKYVSVGNPPVSGVSREWGEKREIDPNSLETIIKKVIAEVQNGYK